MTQVEAVTLDPPRRTPGGLLDVARPLPSGWERGVTFASTQCVDPFADGVCVTGDKPALERVTIGTYDPFWVGVGLTCTTLSGFDVTAKAGDVADVTAEHVVAEELATGAASGNPSLTGSVTDDLGAIPLVVDAIACLDLSAAAALSGRQAFLHMGPEVATHALAERAIWRDGRMWRTAYGSLVVISSGYADVEVGTIWATGDVWAGVGARDSVVTHDRQVNDVEVRAETVGLAVFDPCYVGRAATGVTC